MDHAAVQDWLDRYVAAWRANEREPIEALFTENATYSWRPGGTRDSTATGRDAIVDGWLEEQDDPDSWEASYEVYPVDGDRAVAWCEYGTPEELPNIHHRKDYEARLDLLPNWRLTCIFIDKAYRRRGLSRLALHGALDLIAQAGGGVVEGYPQDLSDGRRVGNSFLYNGTRALYEAAGYAIVATPREGARQDYLMEKPLVG